MREGAPPNLVKLAVARAIIATFDKNNWMELGLLTNTDDAIRNHSRLLRSLSWGDPDYAGCVHDVVPQVLGEVRAPWYDTWDGPGPNGEPAITFNNLAEVEHFLNLGEWLKVNDPPLHRSLYGEVEQASVVTAHGEVLDDTQSVAEQLGVAEIQRQIARLRRDLDVDPESALGHVKDLVESALKTVLGNDQVEAGKDDMPALLYAAQKTLGLHPGDVDSAATNAKALRQLLQGAGNIVLASAQLRNQLGIGHGQRRPDQPDVRLARLVVTTALGVATFLLEMHQDHLDAAAAPTAPARVDADFQPGDPVVHDTFGIGVVLATGGAGHDAEVTVEFPQVGTKRLLVRYAPLRHGGS